MALRYWVGGTNTWNSTSGAKWATTSGGAGGASVPGAADDVFFDAASGAVTVTWASGASATVLSINCTGFTGTLATGGNSKTLAGTGTVWTSPATCTITGAPTMTVSSTGATAISVTCNHASPSTTNAPNFSFSGGTYALTINGTGFRQLAWGPSGAGQVIAGTVSVYGSTVTTNHIKDFTGLNITFLATATFRFNDANSSIAQFPILGDITINAPGGTVSLEDNVFPSPFTLGTTKTLTLTAGTFSVNGRPVSTGRFSSNGTSTRVYSTTSGSPRVQTIELTSTTAGATVLDMANATGFSFFTTPDTTLRPTFVRNQAATATMVFGTTGGTTSNACNLTVNAGASALTITSGSYFRLVNFTGSTCTVTGGYNATSTLTLASGGTYTSFSPTFRASGTLTSNGKTLGGLTINGSGITVTLADAAAMNFAGGSFTLTLGTINLAGFTLSANRLESSNSNVRSIDFGSGGSITLTSGVGGDLVLMTTATNFTWTGTGGINLTGTLSTANYTFGQTGGTSTNVLDVTVSISSAGQVTFTVGTSVRSINCISGLCFLVTQSSSTTLYGNLTLASGGTYTQFAPTFLASATVTSNGKTLGNTTINGSGITVTLADAMTLNAFSTFTLTQGTLDLAGFTLSAGIFSSSNSNTRVITFGAGNIALTSTTSGTTVLSMADATNFTYTAGGGGFTRNNSVIAIAVFGTTGGSTTNAPRMSINAGSANFAITSGSWFTNLSYIGMTGGSHTGSVNLAGTLSLSPSGSYLNLNPTFRADGSLNVLSLINFGTVTVNGAGITVSLSSTGSTAITGVALQQGTLNITSNLTAGSFTASTSNVRALTLSSSIVFTVTLSLAAWNIVDATNLTFTPNTSTISMNNTSAKTFVGGGLTYYNLRQSGSGALTIQGNNTFNDITNSVQPATVVFTAGTTQTVSDFGLSGTAGNLVTINSSIPGTQFNLSKASGTINAQYLSIQDSNATGGAVWTALNSLNVSNNTGWIFPGGNMFLMFN